MAFLLKKSLLSLLAAALLLPGAAHAEADLGTASRLFKEGKLDRAAVTLYEFIGNSSQDGRRAQAEYNLGETLEKLGLYQSALYSFGTILKSGVDHPFYVQSVQKLVDLSEVLDDDLIIPSLLNKEYNPRFEELEPSYRYKVNYLIGAVSYRAGLLDDSIAFLEAVPAESPYHARARYLLGIVTIAKGRAEQQLEKASETAIAYFDEVLKLNPFSTKVRYTDLADLRDLSRLGLARTHYGLGQYADAVKYYEQIPRFSQFWGDALFENGWARFLNEDFGGALGTLQALHAPQFAGSFQPESWILKSTVYYTACLYDEATAALDRYNENYTKLIPRVQPLLEGDRELASYYRLVTDDAERAQLPRSVYNYLAANARLRGFKRYIGSLEAEAKQITALAAFKNTGLQAELAQVIEQQQNVLESVAGKFVKGRLDDVQEIIQGFESQAEIIKFETAKAEKERLLTGGDIRARFASQELQRPATPAEDWEYWRFQGEFWIDEIGYYQFTLKNGCMKQQDD